jgi:hypothetical protein
MLRFTHVYPQRVKIYVDFDCPMYEYNVKILV